MVKSLLADATLGRQEAAIFTQQQKSPATLSVPEELGRLERNAPGDRDNDGYAELRGAYQLKAIGPRFEVKITQQTPRLLRPVLEIAGLPAGRVLAHVEGQQIERVSRLKNGNVLIMLPNTLDRAVTVNVRVPSGVATSKVSAGSVRLPSSKAESLRVNSVEAWSP